MTAAEAGARRSGSPPGEPGRAVVKLVTRLVLAQAVAAAAVGLVFSRRHLPSILITLVMVAAVCGLAVLVRSGGRAAWLIAVGFEVSFVVYGLSRFFFARYLGGTLFAILTVGTLLHPAVARAYGAAPAPAGTGAHGETVLGEAAGEAYGQTVG